MEMAVEGVDGTPLGSGAAGGIGTVAGEETVMQGEGCVARRDGTPITFALKNNVGCGDKCAVVDNVWRDPFSGSQRALNVENGRPVYDLQLSMRVPLRSADASKNIVEPLAKSHFIGIFPTVDNKFLVYGYYGKFQASEMTQNEGENGGDCMVTMASQEPFYVTELWDTDYVTTKAIYDALVAKAF